MLILTIQLSTKSYLALTYLAILKTSYVESYDEPPEITTLFTGKIPELVEKRILLLIFIIY